MHGLLWFMLVTYPIMLAIIGFCAFWFFVLLQCVAVFPK